MKTPYYILKIYDKEGSMVETEEDDDYDYICETFAWRWMNELDRKVGKTGKIFKTFQSISCKFFLFFLWSL